MIMTLLPIGINEDKSKEIYSSEDCQSILKMYKDYYPKIGYNLPWVGYFVMRDNQIVGACGFIRPPINNRVEVAYGTFKEFEGQGIATLACEKLISITKNSDVDLIITAKTPSSSIHQFLISGLRPTACILQETAWQHQC